MNERDVFHATELFLLSSAFEANQLFGLPDKQTYQLLGEHVFSKANERLIEKEILTTEGNITTGGMYVIKALEFYYKSPKYVRMNNLLFAFREKEEDELIVLVELEEEMAYRLLVMSKALVLKVLLECFPFLLREPKEEEKSFFKKELPRRKKKEIEALSLDKPLMNLEVFHLHDGETEKESLVTHEQWLIFTHKDTLIVIRPEQDKYFHASQYWVLKRIFDEMDFPYKVGEQVNGSNNGK